MKGNLLYRIHEVIFDPPPAKVWGIAHNKVCTYIENNNVCTCISDN